MTPPASSLSDVKPPPASIASLIEVHTLQALIFTGRQPNPQTGKPLINLALAKYNIDILEVIQKKTQGNLTAEEAEILQRCLSVARMAYVEATREKKA